ncbi:hypothetical protein DSO57_1033247 [Entomophthora muscae]|uniref:Uncharacterized protein n=1 Tax=Entomophthora muscae TaxID=34485 RepID=A0ACC2SD43_9FUNG|nr:hypothetical protein DSO57_1033247 [Entomophthora muscae]
MKPLRIFDTRKMRAPLKEVSVGGGVWRVRWHPSLHSSVLVAAMHGGFHIVDVDLGKVHICHRLIQKDMPETCPEITRSFLGHQSLAYGADWCPITLQQKVASCSFYDHKLCLW